jgi:hypothetical protein
VGVCGRSVRVREYGRQKGGIDARVKRYVQCMCVGLAVYVWCCVCVCVCYVCVWCVCLSLLLLMYVGVYAFVDLVLSASLQMSIQFASSSIASSLSDVLKHAKKVDIRKLASVAAQDRTDVSAVGAVLCSCPHCDHWYRFSALSHLTISLSLYLSLLFHSLLRMHV